MGYTKIVQYGNVTEVYQYSRDYVYRKRQNHLKLSLLQGQKRSPPLKDNLKLNRKREYRANQIAKGLYSPSKASINRTLTNFFRLVHHNVSIASTVHFITLTFAYDLTFKEAQTHLRRFMERTQDCQPQVPLSYVAVPEQQESGRWHYHLLAFNLTPEVSGLPIKRRKNRIPKATTERDTRYLQNLFGQGFLDICPATYKSRGIAGYMAKYMAKTFKNQTTATVRNYSTSRNIAKVSSYGSNSFDPWISHFVSTTNLVENDKVVYDVPYMGQCVKTRITKIIQ